MLSCIQNQFLHLAKKYATTTPKIIFYIHHTSVALTYKKSENINFILKVTRDINKESDEQERAAA